MFGRQVQPVFENGNRLAKPRQLTQTPTLVPQGNDLADCIALLMGLIDYCRQ